MISKKADVTFLVVIVLVSIVSFGVITVSLVSNSNIIASELDDVACRTLIVGKSNPLTKIGEFFFEINNKCIKEEIKEEYKSKEEIFKDVGDSMQRCWYRYGEGEHDFLSNYDTQGRWCMLCGTIESSNDIGEFNLAEFVEWTEEDDNNIKLKNGSEGKYLDYVNFKYFNDKDNELIEITQTLETLDKTDDSDRLFAEIFEEQYQGLIDLKLKRITTIEDQKNYIVYRFDRLDTNLDEQVTNALYTAGASIGVGIAASIIIENAIVWGGTAAICTASLITGPGAVAICGGTVALATVNAAKTGTKVTFAVTKVSRLSKLSDKMSSMVIFTKAGKTVKAQNLAKTFDGSLADAVSLANKIDRIDPKLADDFVLFAEKLESLGIDDFGKLDNMITDYIQNKKNLHDAFERAVDLGVLNNKGLTRIAQREKFLSDKISELTKIQSELLPILNRGGDLNEAQRIKLVEYIRGTPAILAAGAATYVGTNLDFDSRQYVDVMTQEEYYRLCGTERKVIDN